MNITSMCRTMWQSARNKVGFWCQPESERIIELQGIIEAAFEENYSQSVEIEGLIKSIGYLTNEEKITRENSTIMIASLVATYGGTVKLDGNVIDACASNKLLNIHVDAPEEDGSRTIRLVEREPDVDEAEPTDEELQELETEFLNELSVDDGDELDDEHEDCCPA